MDLLAWIYKTDSLFPQACVIFASGLSSNAKQRPVLEFQGLGMDCDTDLAMIEMEIFMAQKGKNSKYI